MNQKNILKMIAATSFLTLLVSRQVSAEELEVNVTKDISAGKITVATVSVPEDIVTVQILSGGVTPGEIAGNPSLGRENAEYVRNEVAGDDGRTQFVFSVDTGDYVLYAASSKTDGECYSESFNYVDIEAYKGLVEQLKSADEEEFLNIVKSNKSQLGFDIDIYSEDAVLRFCDEYKNKLSENDYELNLKNFRKCCLIEEINSGSDVNVIGYVKKIYSDDSKLMEYIGKYITGTAEEKYFSEKVESTSNKSVKDSDDLIETLKEAMVLTVVKYPSEASDIKSVMKDYKDILGIKSVSDYSSVYRSLEGNEYKTVKGFLDDYEEAVEKASDSKSSGGGGGGGGGGGRVTPSTASGGVVSAPDTAGQTQNIKIFDDIDNVDWAKESIEALYKRGIVNGKENKKFYPEDKVLREEFVKMLVATFDMKLVGGELPFADVSYDAWYYDYVRTAYLAEAVNGVSETEFGIGKNITRQDICTMTYRMLLECDVEVPAVKEKMNFGDEDRISDYAKEAVFALQTAGIINGDTNGNFNPQATATRAETAKIMYGVLNMIERG